MPQCGRTARRTGKTRPLRKCMRPSAFPPRGICRSWRVIGGNDTTFPRPKQAGILKIEVLRAGGNANAQEVICRGNCFSCFRCWEVRSFGDWEKTSKKTPKLQASLSPSSESKEVLCNCLLCLVQADGSEGRLALPRGRDKRGLNYSIWWITATAMCAQMSRT